MKLNSLTSLCVAACLSLSLQVAAETSSPAENDINAEDLTRDLQRQRTNPQAASSIPSELDTQNDATEQAEDNAAPWFKVEIIVFKQTVNSVTEEFPDTTDFTPPAPLITLKGYDYPEQHYTRAQHHNFVYSSSSAFNQISKPEDPTDRSNEDNAQAHIPESAARNEAQKNELHIAYQQEPLELLTDAQTRLEKSQNYQILLATAWKQPTVTKEDSPTLHLVAGNWFDDQPEFEAFLKVSKQRYLHAYADLFLNTYSLKTDQPLNLDLSSGLLPKTEQAETMDDQNEDTSFENQGIQPHHFKLFSLNIDEDILDQEDQHSSSYITNEVYHIKEDRIMKHSKDLYYLDHPKFGMIIKLTPIEQLEENKDS
ncbi:CsiV family protein [Litoribrevibacter albus]|uniref:Peptidoglycan-binding protein CsiV n=1 Tax=Litoribrevibacter albus TaxID=1473156 RepID=A0AA37W6J6_9GAMM|nr:CsiV family protein [Litoribrevibacter albus]GLQ30298.1 hypothetical protein GCM10007876_07760 [Litoribrevibacter albus]